LLEAFEQEHLVCSEEWVLHGTGSLPTLAQKDSNQELLNYIEEYKRDPKQDLKSLVFKILDDSMLPVYEKGDYVGGIKISFPLKKTYYNKPCIVRLVDGKEMVRIVYPGTEENLFTLGTFIPHFASEDALLVNVAVNDIYQIVWHRKDMPF
jgi:hypothetical protein